MLLLGLFVLSVIGLVQSQKIEKLNSSKTVT